MIELNHPNYRVEYFPELCALHVINDEGDHVSYNVVDGLLDFDDHSGGDFTYDDPSIDDIENQVLAWYRKNNQ